VLVNRPLNAMPAKGGGVLRLAEFPIDGDPVDFDRQQQIVAVLEDEYRKMIAPAIPHSGQGMAPAEFFQWALELARVRSQIQGLEHWEQIEQHMIGPHVNQVIQAITRQVTGEIADRWEDWRERYVPELLTLLRGLRREATERSRAGTAAIAAAIDPLLPESRRRESLSRKALWVLVSTPGVSCVLTGMRSAAYVEDALAVLEWEPVSAVRPIYEKLKEVTVQP
jgi:hypothetical protein